MLSMKNLARRCARRARRNKKLLASCAALSLSVTPVIAPQTHVPAGTTEFVNAVPGWVIVEDGTSTDHMFATLEAYGYSTAGLSMSHYMPSCMEGMAGCAVFAPDSIALVMDADYVGTSAGLFILMHEYRHAVVDLRSESLAVDECNADRFAETVTGLDIGGYTLCDTEGIPFPGADYHEPINFVVQ